MSSKVSSETWKTIRNKALGHSLESRIFHVTCLASLILFISGLVFDFFAGLDNLLFILAPATLALAFACYQSRFKGRLALGIMIYAVQGNALFVFYFLNSSGIDGPGLSIYLVFFLLLMAMVPLKQRWLWMLVNLAVVSGLFYYQYHNPDQLQGRYNSLYVRYLDAVFLYTLSLLFVYVLMRTLTNQYNRERFLVEERSAALKHSNSALNRLFSILAHDLRSPLNSIQSYLELSLHTDLTEDETRMVNQGLLKETKYTGQLLTNLLSWSKSQMEGMHVKLQQIFLAEAIKETLALKRSLAAQKNITIETSIPEEMMLTADRDMLELVIRNLLNNAIKFTPSGGLIQIIAEKSADGDTCRVCISDTGIGIAGDRINNIFCLQSENTFGTNQEKGIGLGLVLCKDFMDIQHGEIRLESTLGKGSQFYLTFPA